MPDRKSPSLETLAARYLKDRRGRAQYKGAPPAGRAAAKILKPLAQKFGPGTDRLKEHWSEIVGERLAGWTSPDSLKGQTLYILAKGPAGALIEADAPRILERLEMIMGRSAPTRLRVRQGQPRLSGKAASGLQNREVKSRMSEGVEIDPDARLSSALNRLDAAFRARERGD
ncbi:DciA family protein [Hyphobacterium sp.]|uniref:DciA family protein n=1 Tax=Hyphobacterium sp. TaxID=2004662 RepID=UPI003BAA8B21